MIKDSMFDGYAVTNDGKVYSKKTNKFIKPSIGSKGYFQVCLTVDGKKRTVKVHRIVAETFIPNPEGKPQVNHIDGNKRNNCVENNKKYCSASEAARDTDVIVQNIIRVCKKRCKTAGGFHWNYVNGGRKYEKNT